MKWNTPTMYLYLHQLQEPKVENLSVVEYKAVSVPSHGNECGNICQNISCYTSSSCTHRKPSRRMARSMPSNPGFAVLKKGHSLEIVWHTQVIIGRCRRVPTVRSHVHSSLRWRWDRIPHIMTIDDRQKYSYNLWFSFQRLLGITIILDVHTDSNKNDSDWERLVRLIQHPVNVSRVHRHRRFPWI